MPNPNDKQTPSYIKYSGLAFQMLATIGLMTFIGYKIDENRESKQQIFTAIFGLAGVIISLIQVVKSLSKNK